MAHLLRHGGRGGGNCAGGARVGLSWKSVSYIGRYFVPSNRKRSKCPGLPTKKKGEIERDVDGRAPTKRTSDLVDQVHPKSSSSI